MHAIQNMILKSNTFHEKALPKAQQTSLYSTFWGLLWLHIFRIITVLYLFIHLY